MTLQHLTALLTGAGLAAHARNLVGLARPAIGIDARPCKQNELVTGASRFGGVPDLPNGFLWPRYKKRPLAFLGQIDLSVVHAVGRSALPRSGTLAFFYEVNSMEWGFDPKNRGCSHVAYFERGTPHVRTMPPAMATLSPTCELTFSSLTDLLDSGDLLFETIGTLTEPELEAYWRVLSANQPAYNHHLLGHPQLVQNDMRLECQLVSSGIDMGNGGSNAARKRGAAAAAQWELLLQLDTDERTDWMWGDCGRIYFWIRRQDLAERRFENAWLVLQCG
jgi:uncharacterized protein YwqG